MKSVTMNLLSLFLLLPVCIFCGIEGKYKASGTDPVNKQKYKASVVIRKNGGLYTVKWTYPDSTVDIGTAVKKGNFLSVVFREGESASYGVQTYEIQDGKLKGPWARYGDTKKGYEELKKKK